MYVKTHAYLSDVDLFTREHAISHLLHTSGTSLLHINKELKGACICVPTCTHVHTCILPMVCLTQKFLHVHIALTLQGHKCRPRGDEVEASH